MAMAAEVPAAQPVPPQVVGNAFVQQYYQILHLSPELVHKFYHETSKLGRPDDDGNMSITTTMQAINDKIQSLNYGEFRAEIKSVDAQESHSGGVLVFVTGYLAGKDNKIRDFSQTFFLAPQDRGYFVLNDVFRYIQNGDQQNGIASVIAKEVEAPEAPELDPTPPLVQENIVSEISTPSAEEVNGGEVYNPPEENVDVDVSITEEEVPVAEVVDEVRDAEVVDEVRDAEVVDEVWDESQAVVESNTKAEDLPKKSYASIVMHLKESAATFSPPPPPPRKSVPKIVDQVNTHPEPESNGVVPRSDFVDNGNHQEGEADGYSIYIKGLPTNASVSMLENEFKRFGPIKNNGIQVRSNRPTGFCFGFVEFEVPSAVEKAIEASPVQLGGRQVIVEEKRSTNSRGSNRGRFQPGRGSGYRNEVVRGGRGNYGGGRGYGRGDYNSRNEYTTRGGNRGTSSSRDGYQRSDSDNGRVNRNGGIANGMARNTAPRVSATA